MPPGQVTGPEQERIKGQNKALMRKIIEMFATGDLSNVSSVFAEDYIDHQGLGETEIRGPHGFSRVVMAARRACPHLQVGIEDLIAEGDRAVVRLHWRSAQPDGEESDRETIDIVRFANGQAVEHWGAPVERNARKR
jgi:predicted SnoaL-like aldol condensation-catalyzing enzyme